MCGRQNHPGRLPPLCKGITWGSRHLFPQHQGKQGGCLSRSSSSSLLLLFSGTNGDCYFFPPRRNPRKVRTDAGPSEVPLQGSCCDHIQGATELVLAPCSNRSRAHLHICPSGMTAESNCPWMWETQESLSPWRMVAVLRRGSNMTSLHFSNSRESQLPI